MRRKHVNNLVCQYLEGISRKALEEYQEIIKKHVRDRHGVYALYHKNKLYYVGLASDLSSRLKHHLRDKHSHAWDRFSVYLTVGSQHLHELEALLLRIIDRRGNKQRGKFGRAEDLKRKIRGEFKRVLASELDHIFHDSRLHTTEIAKSEKAVTLRRGRRPTLAPFIKNRLHIKFYYKKNLYIAHARRDGLIKFAGESADAGRLQGKVFTSPSGAASAITGKAMDGWNCWKYERAPGDWVLLNELRK